MEDTSSEELARGAANEAAARVGTGGLRAGTVRGEAGGVALDDVGAASARSLIGWSAPPDADGVWCAGRTSSGPFVVVVLRDGTEHHDGVAAGPVAWLLRRAVGRPSGATSRAAHEVCADRLAAAVLDAARCDPDAVRDAAACGQVHLLALAAARLGPLALAVGEQVGWDRIRSCALAHSTLARWCDAEMFGFLSGYGVAPAAESLGCLDELVGAHTAVLVRDDFDRRT